MKKLIVLFLILILFSINNFATDANKIGNTNLMMSKPSLSTSNSNFFRNSDSEYNLSLMNLQVDVAGFLFFGPQVALDFQFANIVAVGPFVRWNYAGLIYQGVITDWFYEETVISPASYGIGIQARALIPIGNGMHRPYAGVSFERFNGKESYDPGGEAGDHIWEYKANVILFNVGYRMITNSSFNLSVGFSLGASIETENIDYYENEEDNIDHNLTYTRFIGMLQIGLGWQLGK